MKGDDNTIIFFEGEFSDALKHAKKMGKPVFIDFYADWCAPCKLMEKNAFSHPDVYSHINNNFVAVRVNVDYFSGMDIAERFHVKTYPTLIILDKRGKEKSRITGGQTAKKLLSFVIPYHK